MNWTNEPATESRLEPIGHEPGQSRTEGEAPRLIKINKARVLTQEHGKEVELEIFAMTLGTETIELLPLKNWGQLDVHKWTVQGKLPGTPAGLEVAFDHIKMAGETILTKDPEGCSKLEKTFAEWLALEKETFELAARKAHAKPAPVTQAVPLRPEQQELHFQVEVDKRGQVHVLCSRGKETVAAIGLNVGGFNSLVGQGLMRKPHTLKVGALHDWVELDGVLYSFEKGNNDASKLAKALNEGYIPTAGFGQGKEVLVFENAASTSGFDIQFPVTSAGVLDSRRRPLNEESLELLQDPDRCGLLPKGLLIKLTRPTLIFKQKTPDGGERYLEQGADHLVTVTDDDGQVKTIDLSRPVNYLHLSAVELTAVFNHPAINRHSTVASAATRPNAGQPQPGSPQPLRQEPAPPAATPSPPETQCVPAGVQRPSVEAANAKVAEPSPKILPQPGAPDSSVKPATKGQALPNSWLKDVLAQRPIRPDWFTCLVYGKLAERFGNSREGNLGPWACWAVALGETEDIADPEFKGVFLTEKGALGFISQGHIARFYKEVVFLGLPESTLEGIGVSLVAVGLDLEQRVVFIVSNDYRAKFGVPDQVMREELGRLRNLGAVLLSVKEALESREPLEVVWTVPAEQKEPGDPQALESTRPADAGASPAV